MKAYYNSQVFAPRSEVTIDDDLYEQTPVEEYDLNTFLPPPTRPIHTDLVRLEPLIVCSS